jgi:hypothetical protein
MVCLDQLTGDRSKEPLRTLAAWRGKKVLLNRVVSEIWPDKKGDLCWEGIVVRGGLWWGYIRWVVSLEGNNLLVFYYLISVATC